jgi:hypothetical protein
MNQFPLAVSIRRINNLRIGALVAPARAVRRPEAPAHQASLAIAKISRERNNRGRVSVLQQCVSSVLLRP